MITIGPFIIPSTHPDTPDGCFRHTGFSMELVCDGLLFELPIYKNASHLNGQFASFDDFYFPEPEDGWPVDFVFKGIHDKPTRYGRFVAISPLLVEIFNQLRPGMPMEDFLRDFRTAIPIFKNSRSEWREPPHGEINLTEDLANLGFVVSSVYFHGVTLKVDVAWSFQDDHSGWKTSPPASSNSGRAVGSSTMENGSVNDGRNASKATTSHASPQSRQKSQSTACEAPKTSKIS